MEAASGCWQGHRTKEGTEEVKESPSFPYMDSIASSDLCAVSMCSNQVAGGDIKVLTDTRKHKKKQY
jgi:hypothetical protein